MWSCFIGCHIRTTSCVSSCEFHFAADPPKSVYDIIERRPVTNSLRSRVAQKSSKDIGDMLPETRTLLRDFYRPLNAELVCLLGDQNVTWGY